MRTRDPFAPIIAPFASTPGSLDRTAIFVRCPASRAMALISTVPSATSGTSSSNKRFTNPGCVRDTMIDGDGPRGLCRTSTT